MFKVSFIIGSSLVIFTIGSFLWWKECSCRKGQKNTYVFNHDSSWHGVGDYDAHMRFKVSEDGILETASMTCMSHKFRVEKGPDNGTVQVTTEVEYSMLKDVVKTSEELRWDPVRDMNIIVTPHSGDVIEIIREGLYKGLSITKRPVTCDTLRKKLCEAYRSADSSNFEVVTTV